MLTSRGKSVTRGAGCVNRACPDLWEPWEGNDPGSPGRHQPEPRIGQPSRCNQPALALVDVNSFWVQGFFQETSIRNIRAGDRAIVTRWPIRVHPSKVASTASTGGSLTRTAARVTSCYPRLSRPSSGFGSPSACPRSCGPGLRYFPSGPLNPQPKTVENVRANSSSINIILFMAVSFRQRLQRCFGQLFRYLSEVGLSCFRHHLSMISNRFLRVFWIAPVVDAVKNNFMPISW